MGLRQQLGFKGGTAGTELFTSVLGLRERCSCNLGSWLGCPGRPNRYKSSENDGLTV